jgi:hypothetical protein
VRVTLRSVPPGLVFLGTSLLALAFYVPRLCPTVVLAGDSPELVAAGFEWGVPHPPGFPLYTLLLHAVLVVSGGAVAWRANLLSAALHALTLGVVAVIVLQACRRLVSSKAALAGAVTAALVLGLSSSFLFASLYAEVFPLNDLFFALLLLVALPLAGDLARADMPARLMALAVLASFASAAHPFIVMSAPALLVACVPALRESIGKRPVLLLSLAAAFAVPFVGLYLTSLLAAMRAPFVSWDDVHDLPSLARLFARLDYGGPFRTSRTEVPPHLFTRELRFCHLLLTALGPASLLLASAGTIVWLRRSGRQVATLAFAVAVPGPLFALANSLFQSESQEGVALAERFMTMTEIPLAILGGLAVAAACERWQSVRSLTVALPVLAATTLAPRAISLDLHSDRTGEAFAHDLLRDVPDGALVLLTGDVHTQTAAYLCTVERACGSRMIVVPGLLFLPWYRRQIAARYPALTLPDEARSVRDAHRLVELAIRQWPIFTMGQVVQRDPTLARDYALVPSLLLLRVLPAEGPGGILDLRDQWVSRATALADGQACEACETIPPSTGATFEHEVALAYRTGFANSVDLAQRLGDVALAGRLAARGARIGGGP